MRGIYLIAGFVGAVSAAEAGPWTRGDGESYVRLALSRDQIENLDAWHIDAYAERGLNNDWTLTLKAEALAFDQAADFNNETYRATLRHQLYSRGTFLISGEGGLIYGATPGAVGGCRALGGELGLSTGMSGTFRQVPWFAAIDGALRQHEDGCQTQKLDLVYGSELATDWFLISKAYFERGNQGQHSDKLETALLYRFGETDISIAYREEVSGIFEDTGVHISFAYRF